MNDSELGDVGETGEVKIISTRRGIGKSQEGILSPTSPTSAREAENNDDVVIGESTNRNVMKRSKQQPKRINKFIDAFSGGNLLAI